MKMIMIAACCFFLSMPGVAQTTDTINRVPVTNAGLNRFLTAERENLKALNKDTAADLGERLLAAASYFTTAQVYQLLSGIDRDSGKLALARLLYDRVTDQEGYMRLAGLFELPNYRQEFIRWYRNPEQAVVRSF